ncbi:sensor histidine kinase [Deferrisoma palaeochoriense]
MTEDRGSETDQTGIAMVLSLPGSQPSGFPAARRWGLVLASGVVAAVLLVWVLRTADRIRDEARDRFFEQYNHQQLLLAQQAARTIEGTFATFRRHLSLVASLFEEGEVSRDTAARFANSLRRTYDTLSDLPIIDLVVFDRDGTVVAIVPEDTYTLGRNYAWRGYYQWARDRGGPGRMYVTPFMTMQGGQHRGDKALIVAEGIYGPAGAFKGVVTFTVNFDRLARDQVLSVRIGREGYAWLVDADERSVLVDPAGKIGGQSFEQAFQDRWPVLYALLDRAAREREPGVGWYEFEDPSDPAQTVRKLVGYTPVRVEQRVWILGVCTPVREVEAVMASFLREQGRFTAATIGAILLGSLLLASALAAWNRALSRRVEARTRDLNRARRELEAAVDEIVAAKRLAAAGNLALGVVHEIRNPLSSIRMNIQMLRETVGPGGDADENFAIIEEEIQRLNGLLQGILSFARPQELRPVPVDLDRLVRSVVSLCEERLRQSGAEAKVVAEANLPPVRCDPDQVRQVVWNLVLNAVEAMESGGAVRTVRIEVGRDGPWGTVRVSDTGPGIAPEVLENLFDPFVTTKAGGGGLGLAVSQRIVLRHGGKILAETQGSGAAFTVFLPIAGPRGGEAG